jgi:putative peptidoglycan lipid II flippase
MRPSLAIHDENVKRSLHAFGPILIGRGSVQLSGYLDQFLASYLGTAMVGLIGFAQVLYLLPVSLFGMAVSAAELPAMSGTVGAAHEVAEKLQARLRASLRRIVFLVVPSAVAFVAIGDVMIALLFQSGKFTAADTHDVWIILAGASVGLSAGTQGRLFSSAFYALGDTRSPLYAALVRVALTFGVGLIAVFPLRYALGYREVWGAFGLTSSAGVAAWVEFELLRRWLSKRIGAVPVPTRLGLGALAVAIIAGIAAFGTATLVRHLAPGHTLWVAAAAIPVYGAIYLGVMIAAKVPEAQDFVRRVTRRKR